MKTKYKILLSFIGILLLTVGISFSYAYFSTLVENNTGSENVITSGSMELAYVDGDSVTLENALPGTVVEKMFSVKNVGTIKTTYDVYFSELLNGFVDTSDLVYTVSSSSGCQSLEEKTIPEVSSKDSKLVSNCSINPGQKHDYILHVKFKETEDNQDDNKGKTFSTKIALNDYKEVITNSYLLATNDIKELIAGYSDITSFKRVYDAPVNEQTVDISTGESIYPVLAWINENNELFVYSKSKNIFFNESMKYMFCGLKKLKTVDLTGFDTSLVKDMSFMFAQSSIETANLSTLNTSNVTDMSFMFTQSNFKTLDLKSFDTSKVTNMSMMFSFMNYLTDVDVSSFRGNSLVYASQMFENSPNIAALDLKNFQAYDIEEMQYMFYNLSNIKTLDLLTLYGYKVKNADSAFYGMSSLEKINLVNFYPTKIENASGMFSGDSKLKTIYSSGYSWNFSKANNTERSMFYNCKSLVGENGTTYNENNISGVYARLDNPSNNQPGYFTPYRGTF